MTDPMEVKPSVRKCEVDGCERRHLAKGMCSMHWQRAYKPPKPKPSPEQRFWEKVDKSGECWEWTAYKDQDGYGKFQFQPRRGMARAHRVAYELTHGPIPDGMFVDHICHNTSCVNPAHLRLATNKQNLENLAGATKANRSSGVRGVYWSKAARKWQARVVHNGQNFYLGLFATIEEAESAVIAKRLELFTHNDMDRVA